MQHHNFHGSSPSMNPLRELLAAAAMADESSIRAAIAVLRSAVPTAGGAAVHAAEPPDELLSWQRAAGRYGVCYHTIRLWALNPELGIGHWKGGRGHVWLRKLEAHIASRRASTFRGSTLNF
jgi:hypothetical protein